MNQSIDLTTLGKAVANFFRRFHAIIYFLGIGIGIVVCMISIIEIIDLSSKSDATSETVNASFDEKTIERVQQLESRDKNTPVSLPTDQRTNPFVD